MGEDYYPWQQRFYILGEHNRSMLPWELASLVEHLPSLAGELLLERFNEDLGAILNAYPELLTINAKELYEKFCLPLLTSGKL